MSIVEHSSMDWHDDGHTIALQIIGADLRIVGMFCPHESDQTKPCRHPRHGCIVKSFVDRYGLDCNVGSCPAASQVTLCWTNVGDPDDIETMQIWVIPRNDDVFGSWLENQAR